MYIFSNFLFSMCGPIEVLQTSFHVFIKILKVSPMWISKKNPVTFWQWICVFNDMVILFYFHCHHKLISPKNNIWEVKFKIDDNIFLSGVFIRISMYNDLIVQITSQKDQYHSINKIIEQLKIYPVACDQSYWSSFSRKPVDIISV